MRKNLCLTVVAALVMAFHAQAEDAAKHPIVKGLADYQFAPVPGMPSCATAAVLSGDPSKGPSILVSKASAGCTIPWHWHTPNESVMMVSGEAVMEMKDGDAKQLTAGSFAWMPSKHIHLFRCTSACLMYIHSDGIFDMHYVDANGKEITADQAMKMK